MFPDHLIIDFDSTFITKESLDELAKVILTDHREKSVRLQKIKALTHAGMTGDISFDESLSKRIALLNGNRTAVQTVTGYLADAVTPSFIKNINFLSNYSKKILIVSGGFKEIIIPIVSNFGIQPSQIYANDFLYDNHEQIRGVDQNNPMSQSRGKVIQVNKLNLSGDIHVIGDGYTDYELKANSPAAKFFAFTENIRRDAVCILADEILTKLDDYIAIVTD